MISTLLAVSQQIDRDEGRAEEALRDRDRAIGRAVGASIDDPVPALRRWTDRVTRDEDRRAVDRARGALRVAGALFLVLGLVLGTGAAAAVYSYDGSRPINILPALATFVVLPVLLLFPLLLQLLPWVPPGLAGLRDLLLALGAGIFGLATRLLGQRQREHLLLAWGRGRSHQRVFRRVQKWTLLSWSQTFAVGFHLGAIAWLVARVLVSDLSFTWSTTAEFVTADRVHAFTSLLSAPWSQWWSEAVPRLPDVVATQYFRLDGGTLAEPVGPEVLGRWWTFLLASMLTYGLLPRVILLVLCRWQRRRAARWTLLHLPRVDDVLERLTQADVRTQSPEEERTPAVAAPPASDAPPPSRRPGSGVLVRWSGAEADSDALDAALERELGVRVEERFQAGAGQSLREDERVRQEVARHIAEAERAQVVLLVKAWEPATMEALDFLEELRAEVGEAVRIVVVALRLAEDGAADVEQWRHRLQTVGDPWLRTVGLWVEPEVRP